MNYEEIITSPYDGVIEKIFVQRHSQVYERDVLFKIRPNDGGLRTITASLSGSVQSLEVNEGEEVVLGMVLAYIAEDLFMSGSG